MVDFDTALNVLENRTRRQILDMLVREPHYPLQLSKHLDVSQQAVMKHLKVLQEAGFVHSEKVASEKGGPPKRIYSVQESFSLRLDLGPDLFRTEHRRLPAGGPVRLSAKLPSGARPVATRLGSRRKIPVAEGMEMVAQLNEEIERLDSERDALIALHQQVMRKVSRSVEDQFEVYEQRNLVHTILEEPKRPLDLDAWCRELSLGSSQAETLLTEVRERMLFEISELGDHVVATRPGDPLPWWVALSTDD